MSAGTLRITYVKSAEGYKPDQAQTIRSLGFSRLHQTVEKANTPDVRGMVNKVRHLVVIEGEEDTGNPGGSSSS
jgi:large subunit ribosomal protein L30